jgi:hypothetical protein
MSIWQAANPDVSQKQASRGIHDPDNKPLVQIAKQVNLLLFQNLLRH